MSKKMKYLIPHLTIGNVTVLPDSEGFIGTNSDGKTFHSAYMKLKKFIKFSKGFEKESEKVNAPDVFVLMVRDTFYKCNRDLDITDCMTQIEKFVEETIDWVKSLD